GRRSARRDLRRPLRELHDDARPALLDEAGVPDLRDAPIDVEAEPPARDRPIPEVADGHVGAKAGAPVVRNAERDLRGNDERQRRRGPRRRGERCREGGDPAQRAVREARHARWGGRNPACGARSDRYAGTASAARAIFSRPRRRIAQDAIRATLCCSMRIVRPAAAALAWLAAATALCMPLFALAPADASAAELRFVRDGSTVRAIPLDALRKECGERVVTIEDPYYGKQKKFRACPLSEVVRLGFGVPAGDLAGEDVVFRASDGYAKPSSAARLAEDGGYLAFSDADLDGGGPPAWAPIDRKQVDPAPFYVVWSRPEQRDAHVHPWPYALVEIELTSLADRYPHIV